VKIESLQMGSWTNQNSYVTCPVQMSWHACTVPYLWISLFSSDYYIFYCISAQQCGCVILM